MLLIKFFQYFTKEPEDRESAISSSSELEHLAKAHLLIPRLDSRFKFNRLLAKFLSLEREEEQFQGFVVHFDFYKSEQYFHRYYHLITEELFPVIEQIAFAHGFRWKGCPCGDGGFLAYSQAFDTNLSSSFKQNLVNVCQFATDIFHLFKDLNTNNLSSRAKKIVQPNFLATLRQVKEQGSGEYFLLRIGISYGDLILSNSLSALHSGLGPKARPLLESARLTNYAWGVHLARNNPILTLLRQADIMTDKTISLLDDNISLVRFNQIQSKRKKYTGYRVFKTGSTQVVTNQINQLVDEISSWSEHNHFEGNYSVLPDESTTQSEISLQGFINKFETWYMQQQLLEVCKQTQDSNERQELMLSQVTEITQNVIANLELQNIKDGFLFISPHNLSIDNNNLTDLNLRNLDQRIFAQSSDWPDYFQALSLPLYLNQVVKTLKQSKKMDNIKLVVSLRRDKVEKWYLKHPRDPKTDQFLQELAKLKQKEIIAGVDIAGVESDLDVARFKPFLEKLEAKGLLHSVHAGEVLAQKIEVGLTNIIESVLSGAKRIGQGYSFFYLLNANQRQQLILNRDQIRSLLFQMESDSLDSGAKVTQEKFIQELTQFLIDHQVIIQVNLVSNLYTVLNYSPFKEDITSKSFLKRFKHHPLVNLILQQGVEILDQLPSLVLSADDYVATGYTLKEELQVLITLLLERDYKLEDIKYLLDRLVPDYS